MTCSFVFRALIAAIALTAVCEVPAQSKPSKPNKATVTLAPTVHVDVSEGDRVRLRLSEAIELLQEKNASEKSRKKALSMLKTAMKQLEKDSKQHGKSLFGYTEVDPAATRTWATILQDGTKDVELDRLIEALDKAKAAAKAPDLPVLLKRVDGTDLLFAQKVIEKAAQAKADGTAFYWVDDGKRADDDLPGATIAKQVEGGLLVETLKDGRFSIARRAMDDAKKAFRRATEARNEAEEYVDRARAAKPPLAKVYFGELDEYGRVSIARRAKDHAEGEAPKVIRRVRIDEHEEEDDSDGGDRDIVKAINGVRAELRAIRKLMARAHSEMDDDDDEPEEEHGEKGEGHGGGLHVFRFFDEAPEASAPNVRLFLDRSRGRYMTELEVPEPLREAKGNTFHVEVETDVKESPEGTWIQLAPTTKKRVKVKKDADTKVEWKYDTRIAPKKKVKKDTSIGASGWNTAIGIGGGSGGGKGGAFRGRPVRVDETAPEPEAAPAPKPAPKAHRRHVR